MQSILKTVCMWRSLVVFSIFHLGLGCKIGIRCPSQLVRLERVFRTKSGGYPLASKTSCRWFISAAT